MNNVLLLQLVLRKEANLLHTNSSIFRQAVVEIVVVVDNKF